MALGRQFKLVRRTYQSPLPGRTGQRTYRLVDGDEVHAEMAVLDSSNGPLRRHPWNGGGSVDPNEDNWRPGDQQVLFSEEYGPHPGKSVMVNAAMTKGARAMALPMLAQAAWDTAEQGRDLLPDPSLSKHSAPLVKRLKGAGLVPEDAVDTASNSVDFQEDAWPHIDYDGEYEELDLGAAKRRGRAILRATSRKHVPGYYQPNLPGI